MPHVSRGLVTWSIQFRLQTCQSTGLPCYQDSSGSPVARGVRQSADYPQPVRQGEACDGGGGRQDVAALSDEPTWGQNYTNKEIVTELHKEIVTELH